MASCVAHLTLSGNQFLLTFHPRSSKEYVYWCSHAWFYTANPSSLLSIFVREYLNNLELLSCVLICERRILRDAYLLVVKKKSFLICSSWIWWKQVGLNLILWKQMDCLLQSSIPIVTLLYWLFRRNQTGVASLQFLHGMGKYACRFIISVFSLVGEWMNVLLKLSSTNDFQRRRE